MAKKLTSSKAKEILHDKSVHGHPLTDKQRKFFGAIAGGAKPYKDGGKVVCPSCGHSWDKSTSSGKDAHVCHICGKGNVNMKDGGWLERYEKAQNGIEGTMGGLTDKGFNYNGAWGGPSMAMGGSLPGLTGMMYERTGAPSKGPRRNQTDVTDASAQNGMEMKFYQEGLDWKPKNISKDGSVIKDNRGQWAHPGEITEINSNEITMQDVPYDVIGISDEGDVKRMKPGRDYKFKGKKVTEYPVKNWLNKYK